MFDKKAGWALLGVICFTQMEGGLAGAAEQKKVVRPAYCADDQWYPHDAAVLAAAVDRYLAAAKPPKIEGKPLALIAPHAGYRFSAPAAAAAYRGLRDQPYKRVFVLAFSHRGASSYEGVDVPSELTAYQTPLGEINIDRQVVDKLRSAPGFAAHPGVDREEHSLENQLPFLQRVLKDFQLVPLYLGRMTDEQYTQAAKAILPWIDENTLLVASSDFTHFGPRFNYVPFQNDVPNKLRELGEQAAAPLLLGDYDGFAEHLEKTGDTICGRGPILLLLRILAMQGGAEGLRAAVDTSGAQTGDWTHSVSYQSFVYTRRPSKLNGQEHGLLLQLARRTALAYLHAQAPPAPKAEDLPAAVRADGACFVTLQNGAELRGCIGNMEADGPLYQAVIRNAINACQDPRFRQQPVTADEMKQIHVEISYLTPMKRVKNVDEIIVGRHGIYIVLGMNRGVLLPQVAYERGWTRAQFLAYTCRKAMLPPDAWKQPQAQIYSFEAEVFGEAEPAASAPAPKR